MKLICDKCGRKLIKLGGLLFSPPDIKKTCKKLHLCVPCYFEVLEFIEEILTPDVSK